MINENIYKFKDFTLSNYRKILRIAKSNNKQFRFFNQLDNRDKFYLWRHDLEFSPDIALEMAKMENQEGIKSTYFIQLHSYFYNTFEKEILLAIMNISSLGHQLGLHFNTHFYNIKSENKLDYYIKQDKGILETLLNRKISVFSFHNTNTFLLSCDKEKYGGLINVYSGYFKNEVGYCSDSTGIWRYERLEDRLHENKDNKLQVLIHDAMWQDEVLSPRQRIFKIIDKRAEYLKKNYDDVLKKNGAKNVDWDKVL